MEDAVPAGYYRNPDTGGLETIPWPADLSELPPTLGFQIIDWAESKLIHHLDGTPWRYTTLQKKEIVLAFAVTETGDWLYRRVITRLAKGAGKDPFYASLILACAFGPARFSGWDSETGRPVGEPHRKALIGIGANSESQAKELLSVANALVSPELAREIGFTPGLIASASAQGSRIKVVTASERSAEGDPFTDGFLNETHHMTESNGGLKVARVMRRNAAKSPGGRARIWEATNAHEQGGGSVGEKTYDSWQAQVSGKNRMADILYVSVEADPSLSFGDPESDALIVKQAYAHSPWIKQERILAEVYDEETTLADAIRFYANGVAATETAFIIPNAFDAQARTETVEPGTAIALFLDCSKSDDATALVGVRMSDGHIMQLGLWQAPKGAHDPQRKKFWSVPRGSVDARVREVFETYRVAWFGVDPSPAKDDSDEASYWGSLIEQWHLDFSEQIPVWASPKNAVLWDFRLSVPGGKERMRLFTEMCAEVREAIDEDGSLTHDGSAALRTHFHNARTRSNIFGWAIGKETRDSPKKVDLAVAAVAALVGRRLFLLSGKSLDSGRTGEVYYF
ncbi:hypothetical protein ACFWY9_28640 [Amycolatopsis sp. NPDC059027]|uniref:hypothetical protein n=1 Tax=Amycolatopsis sp. NPDC059027 TaxID=3346709 RepID=UPI0036733817